MCVFARSILRIRLSSKNAYFIKNDWKNSINCDFWKKMTNFLKNSSFASVNEVDQWGFARSNNFYLMNIQEHFQTCDLEIKKTRFSTRDLMFYNMFFEYLSYLELKFKF